MRLQKKTFTHRYSPCLTALGVDRSSKCSAASQGKIGRARDLFPLDVFPHPAVVHPFMRGAVTRARVRGCEWALKLVRRQMYGRGKIDLLQVRLIGAE